MLSRARFAAFAIGLVAGLGLALIFVVWTVPEFRSPDAYQIEQSGSQSADHGQSSNTDAKEQTNEPQWWYWVRRLVETEDTLAQWVMAFFSVVATIVSFIAVVLVWRTWAQTKRAADAAWSIGRTQTRAYLQIKEAAWDTESRHFTIDLRIRNSGGTPAVDLKIVPKLAVRQLVGEGDDQHEETGRFSPEDISFTPIVGATDTEEVSTFWRRTGIPADSYKRLYCKHPECQVGVLIVWRDVFKQEQEAAFVLNPLEGDGNARIGFKGGFRVQFVDYRPRDEDS